MWFAYVIVTLVALTVGGIYVRRRIAGALTEFGVRPRMVRVFRWLFAWVVFGVPLIIVVSIVGSVVLGRRSIPRFDGPVASWLLMMPFAWAMLVVLQSLLWLFVIDAAYAVIKRRRGAAAATRMRSIAVLAVVGAFAIYVPVRILVERGDVRVRHHVVGVTAPTTTQPFRIAFIADVQQDRFTPAERVREVYGVVNASGTDVVLSGGDWINTGPEYIREAGETATMLKSRLGVFSVRGDHEHFAYRDRDQSVREVEAAMRAGGVDMVNNEVRWFEHQGKRIGVVFLNYNYIRKVDEATVATLVGSVADADYSIVVTHQLDARLFELLANKVDLVLGAHTHGGQVNPVVGLVHVNLARLETRFTDGRYQVGQTTVIVTAGIGNSVVPFRYAAPGSLELIELRL